VFVRPSCVSAVLHDATPGDSERQFLQVSYSVGFLTLGPLNTDKEEVPGSSPGSPTQLKGQTPLTLKSASQAGPRLGLRSHAAHGRDSGRLVEEWGEAGRGAVGPDFTTCRLSANLLLRLNFEQLPCKFLQQE
jgi:hypothetical protein